MSIIIPEMQNVKKNFPIYKDMDDVALLNMAARKYPQSYKGLAMQWGEKIRTERTTRAAAQAEPKEKIPTSPIARASRFLTRSAGLKRLDTAQYIQRNIGKVSPPQPGENIFEYHKRFKTEIEMDRREQEIASLGTVAQFDDMMTLGITTGLLTHPGATIKMLTWFAGIEKVADITGINKAIQGVENATVKDVLDIAKFGLEGMLAGGLTKLGAKRAKANIAKSKAHPKVKAAAEKIVVDLEAAAKAGEKVPDSVKYNKAEFTLKQALAQADAAQKAAKLVQGKPKVKQQRVTKAPSVSSKVEVMEKVITKETATQRRQRIFEESKAHQEAKKKETGIGRDFERRLNEVLNDVSDALGGKEGSSKLSPKGKAKQKAAIERLKKDAEKSGKELSKYLQENLKLNNASVGAIVKAASAPDGTAAQIKIAKGKSITPEELAKKPINISSEIIQEKMRNAKSEAHRKNIEKKYGVKYETPTSDPAVVKNKPAIDPLMEKDTLFNPKDKASQRFNDKINKNLDIQLTRALKLQERLKAKGKESKFLNDWIDTTFGLQGMQERTGVPVYSKSYLQGVEIANIHQRTTDKITTAFAKGLKGGSHSPEGDARILKWITKKEGVLTVEEMKAAHKIQKIVRDFKPMIKYLTMRDYIAGRTKIPKGNKKLVVQGRRVLKKQGVEALEVWVKDKPFGVIAGDTYLPSNILRGLKTSTQKQGPYEIILPQTKQRIAAEQVYDDSIPLLARMHQYVESTLRKYYFQDYLLETQKMIEPYKGTLSLHDIGGFERWLGVLQGQGIPGVGSIGRAARKARGQFFKTVLFDPYKWGRNIVQNIGMLYQNYPLSTNIVKTAQMLRTKLSSTEREFFNTHVSQLGALRREYLYLYEGKISKSPYGRLNASATKVAEAYTLTDTFNRLWAFKHALAGSLKDMTLYKNGKINLNTFIKRQGLGSMTDLEVKHIMGLKPEQARLQIARFIVEKTHVRYKKHERGIAALSEAGEIGSSLLQFPRTVISRYFDGARMLVRGRNHHEQWQGAQLIIGYGIMQWVANEVLFTALGSKAYYDPDLKKEVEARPYGLMNAITGINFGGAQISQVKDFSKGIKLIVNTISEEINGRFKGAKGHKRRMTMIREILKIGDRFGESFQPYWKKALDALESMTDHKSYKLLTTTFDHATKRTSALKRNKVERDIITKIMHFIVGTEARERKAFDPSTLPIVGQHIKSKGASSASFYINK